MGTANASTIAQNHYTTAMHKYLQGTLKDGTPIINRVINFQDDFLIGSNTREEMLVLIKAFLEMCEKAGIQMNPAKTNIKSGRAESGIKFYGFTISSKGISPAEKT